MDRKLFYEAGKVSHVFHLRNLGSEIFQVKPTARFHLFGDFLGLFDVDVFRHILHERDNVAHAEDATCHLLGIKGLEAVEFFSGTDEFDGFAGDHAHRKRRTPATVAVRFRQNHAR